MDTVGELKAELKDFKYSDYLRKLGALESANRSSRDTRIAILRSYTVETIAPVLKFRLLLEGFKAELLFGGYNQYAQEIIDPDSALYAFRPNVILLMLRIEELLPDFIDEFDSRSLDEWEEHLRVAAHDLAALVVQVQERGAAQVLVQNLSLATAPYWGIYDSQVPNGQNALIQFFNRCLAERLAGISGAFIWDFNRLIQKVGFEQLYDPKMWYFAKNPYKQSAYPLIVDDLMRYLLSMLGVGKKCIVVDLDNTLWGGVVGEDGIDGIQLGHEFPGNCFRSIQRELLTLHHRGIILAINSKNNEADALEVLDSHPDMILRREHFSVMQINWQDKASNLREIARALNIGVDSMIMLDDSPAECEQIRQQLPECEVICLPSKPYLLAQAVSSLPSLENIRLTAEDKTKGLMYRQEAERQQQRGRYEDLDEFLKTLNIEVAIEFATGFSTPRIAQLTQKTNQMNLTTRRYTEADIESMMRASNSFVFSVSSRDKFGDNGIVGVIVLVFEGHKCRIDSFLLSCRVIGRKIESCMLDFICAFASRKSATTLVGEFLPTAKNAPAKDIYASHGFTAEEGAFHVLNLRAWNRFAPDFIEVSTPTLDAVASVDLEHE